MLESLGEQGPTGTWGRRGTQTFDPCLRDYCEWKAKRFTSLRETGREAGSSRRGDRKSGKHHRAPGSPTLGLLPTSLVPAQAASCLKGTSCSPLWGSQVRVSQPAREVGGSPAHIGLPSFFCNCLFLFCQAPGPSFQADWKGN